MAAPTVPVVLFVQNNQIYVEFDTEGCTGAIAFTLKYTQPTSRPVVFLEGTEDEPSRKGTVRRYYFATVPSTPYSFYSQAVYPTGPYGKSDFANQISNGRNSPPPINTLALYADNETILIRTLEQISPLVVSLKLLYKVVGDDFYSFTDVPVIAGQIARIELDGVEPVTSYQYFFQTTNPEGITNGPLGVTKTQQVGCPVGQPTIGAANGLQRAPYVAITTAPPGNPNAIMSLTVFSEYDAVTGDGLVCSGALVLPNGQQIFSTINSQDVTNKTSVHTFNGLDPNTEYVISSVVQNRFGIQQSKSAARITTPLPLTNPLVPDEPRTLTYQTGDQYGIVVDGINPNYFYPPANPGQPLAPQNVARPPYSISLEVCPTADFNPNDIIDYPWSRSTPYSNTIISDSDLPLVPAFIRCRIVRKLSAFQSALRYSNVYIYDGLGKKKSTNINGDTTDPDRAVRSE